MRHLVIIAVVLMTYTGISLGQVGKALFTPFHGIMAIMMGYIVLFAQKARFTIPMSLLVLVTYIVSTNLLIHTQVRVTSIIYTILLAFEFLIVYHLMIRSEKKVIEKAFYIIMVSYALNIFLGYVFSSLYLNIGEGFINVHRDNEGHSRPMGFSSEPSYAAFLLSITYLGFNHLRNHRFDGKTKMMSFLYLVSIILMQSAYGFIFVAVNFLDWVIFLYQRSHRSIRLLFVTIAVAFVAVFPLVIQQMNNSSIARLKTVYSVLNDPIIDTSKKLKKMQEVDGSAYARIGPTFLLLNLDTELPIDLKIGGGAGAAGQFFKNFMAGILVDDEADKLDIGIIPAFVFDYGIIGSILLLAFILFCAYNLPLPFWICLILILPNANINTQLFWYGMLVLSYISIVKKEALLH